MSDFFETIDISGLGSSGEGVGTLNGMKVFVEGALPGETISCSIFLKKSTYAKAKLHQIIKASPSRVTPPCPHYHACGGCQLMHLSYGAQLENKRQKVVDSLKRIGHLDFSVAPCCPSPMELHYRNKIQLPLIWHAGKAQWGLFMRNSHTLIPVDSCLIQCTSGEKILHTLKPLINSESLRYVIVRNGIRTNESLVLLVTRGGDHRDLAKNILSEIPEVKGVVENINRRNDNVILGNQFHLLCGQSYIHEQILDRRFQISAPSFFQVNILQAEKIFKTALEFSEISSDQSVIDAFCGVGVFALLASEYARNVKGIECIPTAIHDAKQNALLNNRENCIFQCGKAENLISEADLFFLNPPRKGCDPVLLEKVVKLAPSKIVYLSCNPATLARDLSYLCNNRYKLQHVIPFDLFPQTAHVETLVLLTRS